jgi:hypothetical protein
VSIALPSAGVPVPAVSIALPSAGVPVPAGRPGDS